MMEVVSNTYDRYCYSNGECHCDWRINIYNCEEENTAYIINLLNIASSAIVLVIGLKLLHYRVAVKGHPYFDTSDVKGWLRPKPVEVMLFSLNIYNFLRLWSSVVLVADWFPGNIVVRQFLYEIPWPFGYGAFALYLIGIAQTLADTHRVISTGWLPSPLIVDIIGTSIFLAPFIFNQPTIFISGYLATKNIPMAEMVIRFHYLIWAIHCVALTVTVLLAGLRLVRILTAHLDNIRIGRRYDSIRVAIFKIRAVMLCIVVCLGMFACMLASYGILRHLILTSTVGNMALSAVWMLLGPVTTFCVEIAVASSPRLSSAIRLGTSSSINLRDDTDSVSSQDSLLGNDEDHPKKDNNRLVDVEAGDMSMGSVSTKLQKRDHHHSSPISRIADDF
ncbi:hypothetical protein BJV82DRAFT_624384 [Fennellomyces sp. T-0311]|nr:hypothetical protein BJV82DRAFT_624384 [Fennellomyces sp. T-0311]